VAADLRTADLRVADLRVADLRVADLLMAKDLPEVCFAMTMVICFTEAADSMAN
jgi:uncharacterized protein YjbI with pentapeptide repeats